MRARKDFLDTFFVVSPSEALIFEFDLKVGSRARAEKRRGKCNNN